MTAHPDFVHRVLEVHSLAFGGACQLDILGTVITAAPPFAGHEQYEAGDKLVLPSQFFKFMNLLDISPPYLFCVAASPVPSQHVAPKSQHVSTPSVYLAGVQQFTAPAGDCYMPYWMMQALKLDEGDRAQVLSVPDGLIPPACSTRLRPHESALTQALAEMGPREVMEHAMQQYSALVAGQTLTLRLPGLAPLHLDVLSVSADASQVHEAQTKSERWHARERRKSRRAPSRGSAAAAAAMAEGAGGAPPRTPPYELLAPLLVPALPSDAREVAARLKQQRARDKPAHAPPQLKSGPPSVPAALLYGSVDLEVDFAPAADTEAMAASQDSTYTKASRLRSQVEAVRGAGAGGSTLPPTTPPASPPRLMQPSDVSDSASLPSPDEVLFAAAAAEAIRRRAARKSARLQASTLGAPPAAAGQRSTVTRSLYSAVDSASNVQANAAHGATSPRQQRARALAARAAQARYSQSSQPQRQQQAPHVYEQQLSAPATGETGQCKPLKQGARGLSFRGVGAALRRHTHAAAPKPTPHAAAATPQHSRSGVGTAALSSTRHGARSGPQIARQVGSEAVL